MFSQRKACIAGAIYLLAGFTAFAGTPVTVQLPFWSLSAYSKLPFSHDPDVVTLHAQVHIALGKGPSYTLDPAVYPPPHVVGGVAPDAYSTTVQPAGTT